VSSRRLSKPRPSPWIYLDLGAIAGDAEVGSGGDKSGTAGRRSPLFGSEKVFQ